MSSPAQAAMGPSDTAPLAPRRSFSSPSHASPPTPTNERQPEVISNEAFSKTWVLPPRKKPGRKAANDVPPTKRQAQNRAAQKAFRDRKSTRMNELEQENADLRTRLNRMEVEMAALRNAFTASSTNRQQPDSSADGVLPGTQLASPAPSAEVTCETCVLGKDCVCINVNPAETSPVRSAEREARCGLCSDGSCICEDLGLRDKEVVDTSTSTAPQSPPQGIKRKRSSSSKSPPLLSPSESFPMEIDFTTAFMSNSLPSSSMGGGVPRGGCGFCSEGTPCVCLPNTLPPLQVDSVPITPRAHPEALRRNGGQRPKVIDVSLSDGLVPAVGSPRTIASGNGRCTGVPGTCLQCQSDPMSTLFCQTLSKKLETPISSIRNPPRPTERPESSPPTSSHDPSDELSRTDTYLPCSAVYQTLSRHRNFNKMSLEVIVDGLAKGEHKGMEFAVDGVEGVLRRMDKEEVM